MSKIVFFCIPAYGHTNPTLGVVKELVEQGHEVIYYSFDEFKERIENVGANYISCNQYDLGITQTEEDNDRIGKDILFSTELIVRSVLAMDKDCTEQIKEIQPDVIVADSVAYWGKLIAKKLNIPFVSSTTTFAFNAKSSSIMKTTLSELVKMMIDVMRTKKVLLPLRELGYPVYNILDIIKNDNETNTVVYTSKEFQPFAETFSDKYTFVGPSLRKPIENIEKNKDKLVYISLGTVNNSRVQFYHQCIEALKEEDVQVIMSIGKRIELSEFKEVPENFTICQSVDQMAVLEKTDVFLSHCGMNSANESLAFGVPLVLFPQTQEQSGVARRLEQVGAGILLHATDAESIKKAVFTILSESDYRENAIKMSESFKRCTGTKGAAQAILDVIQ